MAVAGLYDKGREGFLDGTIDWDTDDIRCILLKTGQYTVNLVTHDFLDDVPGAARIQVQALAGKTKAAGVADANDVTFTAVPAGGTTNAVLFYKHTGVDATSRLVGYTDQITGFPVTPNGGDVTARWHASGIFKL